MGTVFDAKTKIGRAVKDKGNDKVAPYCGNIGSAIDSTSFLIPVSPGIDTEYIHDDCGKVMNGSITQHCVGNVQTTIDQNEMHTVNGASRTVTVSSGNNSLTVGGNQDWTITGSHMSLHTGPKTETLVSPLIETHSAPKCRDEPTTQVQHFGVDFEKKEQEFTQVTNKFEITTMTNEINMAFKNEYTTLHNDLTVVDYGTVLGIAIEPKVSEVHLKPLRTFLEGANAKVAGGKVAVAPGVNAVPGVPTSHQ
jgi:hypothetical protein